MFSAFVNVVQTIDRFQEVQERLKKLSKVDLLVGVPQENSTREDNSEEINNAELAYIHTHGGRSREMINDMQSNLNAGMPYSQAHSAFVHENGSPLFHIPPRPILEPAINYPENKSKIANCLKDACLKALENKDFMPDVKKAGIQAQNAVRAWFVNPSNNWAPNSPYTIAKKGSSRPLIDEGELRKSMTYVIREKG